MNDGVGIGEDVSVARLLVVGASEGDEITTGLSAGSDHVRSCRIEEADGWLEQQRFDVVVWLGPGPVAREWCSQFRADGGKAHVLVITSEPTTVARISTLDCGADDVLVRPIAIDELRAHVRALTRRGPLVQQHEIVRGEARLDMTARRAWLGEHEVTLTPGEWRIIEYLEMNAGRVASRFDILEALYGEIADARKASLEVLIGRIRRKLGTSFIRTVRGRGYAVG